jgi:hypothetical protein
MVASESTIHGQSEYLKFSSDMLEIAALSGKAS